MSVLHFKLAKSTLDVTDSAGLADFSRTSLTLAPPVTASFGIDLMWLISYGLVVAF